MGTTVSHRAVVSVDAPSHLLTLQLPPGMTLEKWVEQETARLREQYPRPKEPAKELGRDYAEMLRTAKHQRDFWTTKYELLKLELREDLGWAKKGLADGIPFIDRRQFPVSGYTVDSYDQDALFPV